MNFRSLYRLNLQFINAGGKVKYLLRLPSLSKTLKLLKKNQEIISNRKHDTIYICGLGPSLADVDLDKLVDKEADTLVVNHFFKMADQTNLKPTYYLMADAGFMKPKHIAAFNKAIEMYKDTTFIWNSSFQTVKPNVVNFDCKKNFLAMYNGYYIDSKKIDITKVMPAFGNVICAAIAFAIGAGYKKVVLLGCDFNSFAFPHEIHCYDGGKDNKAARRISLDFELFCYCFDASVHIRLAEYAKTLGVEIINSTRGSLIDAYPMNIDESLYRN
ncbi:hypothetical protein [Bacteroides sp.]|uniref:hypothetical protein n=1 Tax=Bacteroides sp. TaxID=29523 RepID=UPI0025C50960|nr:hypothetical protein [Bacteroides sp.]